MRRRWVAQVGAVVALAILTLAVARVGPRDRAFETVTVVSTSVETPRLNPLTPLDRHRVPPTEAEAIARLAAVASADTPDATSGHSHVTPVSVQLPPGDRDRLALELAIARAAALELATVEAAEAAGYRAAAVPGAGVGTHFVKWSLIDQPFDPARPSMLLFDLRPGRVPQLAGLSYWLRASRAPDGFVGPNDVWHQHAGYCIVNGWIDRENAPRSACAGTWLGGADLWMLHAWVLPRWENRDGVFANLNPKLCPPDAGTPDIARCSFFGAGG